LEETIMKARFGVLMVMLVAFAAVLGQKAIAGKDNGGIPLLAGQFSSTAQGSVAICLNPTSFAEESCSTSGVLVVPFSLLDNGAGTLDSAGNTCFTYNEVDSNFPVDASPPSVFVYHVVGTGVSYDSTTGTGAGSFTSYSGGQCNGATFDNNAATVVSSGEDHFVITDDGKRLDFLITKLTNATSSIGDFSFSGTSLRQTKIAR
jgi:hypothetical protein